MSFTSLPSAAVCFRLLTEPASLKQLLADRPPRRAGSFRLLTEPASLKHHRRRCRFGAARVFPAPHRAGLIEARVHRVRRQRRSWKFPAPHRAGLIEARCRYRPLGEARRFPAPHRAGLIEATTIHEPPSLNTSSFRLLTEPASLKPVGRRLSRNVPPGFRLLTEPASLKRPGDPRARSACA